MSEKWNHRDLTYSKLMIDTCWKIFLKIVQGQAHWFNFWAPYRDLHSPCAFVQNPPNCLAQFGGSLSNSCHFHSISRLHQRLRLTLRDQHRNESIMWTLKLWIRQTKTRQHQYHRDALPFGSTSGDRNERNHVKYYVKYINIISWNI